MPRPWEDNRPRQQPATTQEAVCYHNDNTYRHDTPPHLNHGQHAPGPCNHCGQWYPYQPYRGFRPYRGPRYFGNRRYYDNRRREQYRDNTWRDPQMENRDNLVTGFLPGGRNDQQPNPATSNFDHSDRNTSSPTTCFNCNQPGHFTTHCPNDPRGKTPTINMITVDVQQVTTRSKATQSPWET